MKISISSSDSFSAKYLGMMFGRNTGPLYFETRWGVHTFFVNKPIVICILDEHNIVQIKKKLVPWRIFVWNPKYKRVVEMLATHKSARTITTGSKLVLA